MNLKYEKTDVSISFKIGDVCLKRFFLKGIWIYVDIFSLSDSFPFFFFPEILMKKENLNIACVESYPLNSKMSRISVSIRENYLYFIDSTYKHYYIETKGDIEKYFESRKKIVSTIRRKIKKIENRNKKKEYFEIYSSPDELETFFDLAVPIAKKTFQHLLLDKGLPDTESFKKEVCEKSKKGEILGYILNIDDKPVAYNFCPVFNKEKVLYDYSGYDPEYKDYSPGTVLQFKIIEDLFKREGIKYYDLCTGDGWHKEMFATGYKNCGNVYFCFLNSRFIFVILAKACFVFSRDFLKEVISFLNLKESLKKMVRNLAVKFKKN